ncbi:glycosyltransferase family 2 protein [Limobrevibacterium gyesilva]|uniref:Glycosyltransferase n=1 Tax=Limobrevibacterium gyesilva TaxID=2991712 RepID=A0AA41YJJ7_9PROT|nr:glycosyltransferase [Limobrevibacterium gyesilva]MCW3472963.1 glycosyltransferase [Limobrevibacterium gyesilva]
MPQDQAAGRLRIAVGIVTMRRPAILAETLRELGRQSRRADRTLVCATGPDDIAGEEADRPGIELLLSPAGMTRQRNRLLDAAGDCDVIVFFDDDFLPDPGYLAATERALLADPAIVVATGLVLADGVRGPGLSPAQGRTILSEPQHPNAGVPVPVYNGYGCNMAIRLDVARQHGLRFDEGMPLYAWYEDIDFTRRVGAFGRMVRLPAARGVHLGTKTGRGPGAPLGYAQVVNPVYLCRKGSYHWRHALVSIGQNLGMNLVRAAWPEPHVDRRGRLRGNLLGLLDLLRGHADPARAGRVRTADQPPPGVA